MKATMKHVEVLSGPLEKALEMEGQRGKRRGWKE